MSVNGFVSTRTFRVFVKNDLRSVLLNQICRYRSYKIVPRNKHSLLEFGSVPNVLEEDCGVCSLAFDEAFRQCINAWLWSLVAKTQSVYLDNQRRSVLKALDSFLLNIFETDVP